MAPEEKLKTYRILQILGNRYNDAYSMFTVHITIFATENLIVGIYGTIKFVDQMPPDKYINFPLMVIIMLIFIFTQYIKNASIYQETSDEFQNTLSSLAKRLERCGSHPTRNYDNNEGIMDLTGYHVGNRPEQRPATVATHRKALAKEIVCTGRSCAAVGVPFGSLYYIKQTTALNILNFICCNTISTLITYP